MDETTPRRPRRRLLTAGCAGAAALVLATAGPAAADTSVATANALKFTAVLSTGSGTVTATSGASTTGNTTPLLSVLGTQNVVQAGALVQQAVALDTGFSAACAGLVAPNGSISVGADGTCVPSGGTGQVVIALGSATLKADAVLATCTARSDGTTTEGVKLVNASVTGGTVAGGSLGTNPAAGTTLTVKAPLTGLTLATLGLRSTDVPSGAGSVRTSALKVSLAADLTALTIGTVTCGANAKTVPANALPGPALPLSAAALVAVGLRFRRPVLHALTSRSTRRG
ncbi:hypothetical protein [Kineococcus aurantiacus]|uniref:Secreted protein n=1 Tax=Kineococcus aurantiacus TaxID=37633 RepID=A0A7Y9DMT4_9ACTN|nr:hypothetical protein [Kineococcus aurantiacus]NYD23487.1 hypothetical protein [Kineococcus aurantiacus]